ncbi:GNAT family N-acetyltransferase [Schaalia naturae]|jgi:predicted GNAT family acetyltransferase|uniref:GNAT family N-acetyltransferase n=1 Tax=Schaalia naturae TaxID=635203 RepID=A0ABW2SP74_9ACTO
MPDVPVPGTRPAVEVRDVPERRRFEAAVGGEFAGFAEYELGPDRVVFTHTEVLPPFEGRGVGSALARHALDRVREDGRLRVVPLCPFIKGWVNRHPEYRDLMLPASAEDR